MSLFALAFTGIFSVFVLAAVVGHCLLIGALLRPFLGKLDLSTLLMWHGLRPQPARIVASRPAPRLH